MVFDGSVFVSVVDTEYQHETNIFWIIYRSPKHKTPEFGARYHNSLESNSRGGVDKTNELSVRDGHKANDYIWICNMMGQTAKATLTSL